MNLIGVNGGKVECQIFGVPKPKVVWYKDFHPLKETFRVQAYHYPPDVYTLFIEDYITRVSAGGVSSLYRVIRPVLDKILLTLIWMFRCQPAFA